MSPPKSLPLPTKTKKCGTVPSPIAFAIYVS